MANKAINRECHPTPTIDDLIEGSKTPWVAGDQDKLTMDRAEL